MDKILYLHRTTQTFYGVIQKITLATFLSSVVYDRVFLCMLVSVLLQHVIDLKGLIYYDKRLVFVLVKD